MHLLGRLFLDNNWCVQGMEHFDFSNFIYILCACLFTIWKGIFYDSNNYIMKCVRLDICNELNAWTWKKLSLELSLNINYSCSIYWIQSKRNQQPFLQRTMSHNNPVDVSIRGAQNIKLFKRIWSDLGGAMAEKLRKFRNEFISIKYLKEVVVE